MQEQPQSEKEARYSQETVEVGGSLFVKTELFRTDLDSGKEFCTLRIVTPYKGTIEDRKQELEAIVADSTARHDAVVKPLQAQIAEIVEKNNGESKEVSDDDMAKSK